VAVLELPLYGEAGAADVMRYDLCLHLVSGEDYCTTGAYLINE